jgi:cephalosporin hydroxylase
MNKQLIEFYENKKKNIELLGKSTDAKRIAIEFISASEAGKYSYNFSWMGRPIIAFPQDMIAMQEIIWECKPDLIIETGIAHGGSIVYYSSLLELIGKGEVLGIDIDIRQHNRELIEAHPMFKRISLLEGSSISEEIIKKVKKIAENKKSIMVLLDSNHTHAHVLKELELYAPLVSKGSYMVVFDTIIEDLPENFVKDRDWGKENNPKTAVWEFLQKHKEFEIDVDIQSKLLITTAPDGFLVKKEQN